MGKGANTAIIIHMDDYLYSVGMLKRIASAYQIIYSGIPANRTTNCTMEDVLVYILEKDLTGTIATRRELADLLNRSNDITDVFSIAEYKADFDMSLSSIGRGEWRGLSSSSFRDYRYFGRLQRLIIADILHIEDNELRAFGFTDIPKLRGMAYYRMMRNLNDRKSPQD